MHQRTDLAEEFVARFSSVPLVTESVFLRPKYLRGGIEREVADLLFVHRRRAIIISLKHQADPHTRSKDRAQEWAKKHAAQAAVQLKGAISTLKSRRFWCEHLRRGRVDFDAGDLKPVEAIAAVEAPAGGEVIHLANTVTLIQCKEGFEDRCDTGGNGCAGKFRLLRRRVFLRGTLLSPGFGIPFLSLRL